jgi:hypothetical protein
LTGLIESGDDRQEDRVDEDHHYGW